MKKVKLSNVLTYIYPVLLGTLLAFDYALFIVPNNFAPSGVNGIAVMVQHVMKRTEYVSYVSLLINIPLCVFAYFKIDKVFAVKTLEFSLSYSLIFLVLTKVDAIDDALKPFVYESKGVDTIYPALIAGRNGYFGKVCEQNPPRMEFLLRDFRYERNRRPGELFRVRRRGGRRYGLRLQARLPLRFICVRFELCRQQNYFGS